MEIEIDRRRWRPTDALRLVPFLFSTALVLRQIRAQDRWSELPRLLGMLAVILGVVFVAVRVLVQSQRRRAVQFSGGPPGGFVGEARVGGAAGIGVFDADAIRWRGGLGGSLEIERASIGRARVRRLATTSADLVLDLTDGTSHDLGLDAAVDEVAAALEPQPRPTHV